MPRVLFSSSSAALRLERAQRWLTQRPRHAELLLIGGSVEGVFDLSRTASLGGSRGATFGWHRVSLHRLALRLAERALLEGALNPASPLALEAIWTRVVHQLALAGKLGRFTPVADQPGLPRALARTVEELRLASIAPSAMDADLAHAASAFDAALTAASVVDRAGVLRLALSGMDEARQPLCGLPLLLLDVSVQVGLERDLLQALARHTDEVFATVPQADQRSTAFLEAALETKATLGNPEPSHALTRLQQNLFGQSQLPHGPAGDEVSILSAPGELRECVEIARQLQEQAARGVPFDKMAVLLRAPGTYRAPLFEALRRAGVPVYCARGSRAPDPAGRALLALLACAEDGLSASRFAEYLSLGEVPAALEGMPPPAPPAEARWIPADPDDVEPARESEPEPEPEVDEAELSVEAPVAGGNLRAPRRWEQLLVDAAVMGGRARWERRLDGLAAQFKLDLGAPDVSEANAARLNKALADLKAFRAYALPLLDLLAALPATAPWSQWLEHLSELASRALRHPHRVLSLFAQLAPMGVVGPVGLREVRRVLSQRLLELPRPPPSRRFGQVFIGPIDAARGMAFEVVFIPGLAERIFPQKVREDPIVLDLERKRLGGGLETDQERVAAERLQLQLAVGAAKSRVVLSYPRLDVHDGRPRVPSFYGLEALRAAEGILPRYEELRRRSERAVKARIGWPAPQDPATAIDVVERDLSVLDGLFRGPTPAPRGGARYLTQGNRFLARALRMRYQRWQRQWTSADGLVKPSAEALAALLPHQLSARAFSATALQHFAACPYRFFLSAILRLSPRQEPAPLEELEPMQRGSIVHEVQYSVLTALRKKEIPLDAAHLDQALEQIDQILESVAEHHEDLYAPAIDRVWEDGLVAISADVREWLRRTVQTSAQWAPWKYELAFGLAQREQQDPQSRSEPAELDSGLRLRGSIDLVELSPSGALRATDYKTGKARAEEGTVLGGGKTLQPILYALALEKLFPGQKVEGGRLHYCTQAGGFSEVSIPLNAATRAAAAQAVGVVGQALEKGFLPAAPAKDECTWCDYKSICGAHEERRLRAKSSVELQALEALRKME
jgi:ATP-dependent helicase/nuclease subunit B